MNNSQDQVCRTCKHLHMDGELAECRKNAPRPTSSPCNKERTCWPYVDLDDYCDEWSERKPKKAPETEAKVQEVIQKVLDMNKPNDPNMGLLDIK